MTQRTSFIAPLLSLALTCLSGCDSDVEEITDRASGTGGACSVWRCGLNAAEVNGRSLQELNLAGQANADGVRIVGYVPPPLALLGGYTLAVEGDELVARRSGSTLKRQQLAGSIILVQLPGGLPLPVTILGSSLVPSWAEGGAPIVAYTLVYPEPLALLGVRNVCSGSLLDPLAAEVTVLGGETYDGASKTVQSGKAGWFTLACAGSAAAKLKLLGYGPQSQLPGTSGPASPAARQATLKMITADYCGDGESHTANGTPVVWENREGSVDSSDEHTPGAIEALWDEHGALCLGDTRVAGVEVGCDLPGCDGLELEDGAWRTHVALGE